MFFNGCIWTKYLHVFSHSPQFPLLRIFFSLRTSLLSKRGNVLEKLVFHRVEHIVICILQQTLLVASHEGLVQGNHTPVCQELIDLLKKKNETLKTKKQFGHVLPRHPAHQPTYFSLFCARALLFPNSVPRGHLSLLLAKQTPPHS